MAKIFRIEESKFLQQMILRLSLLLLIALSGCATQIPELPPPAVATAPVPEPEPEPPVVTPPVAQPVATIEPPPAPEPVSSQVAIVLSNTLPAYTGVASALLAYLEDYIVYDLSDRNRTPRQVFSAIGDSDARLVVAIGLRAATVAKSFATVPVIFSQVFNVNDSQLVSDEIKGVASLPPMDLQVQAWQEMDPDILNIGAIVGEGHEDIIAETELAMQERGMRLHYAISSSDRETMYLFKRLIRDLDGFLLFPDNRILSRAVLLEMMSEAARHHVQVAAFNDSFLEHGATFSASSVDSDIADNITIAMNKILDGDIDDIDPLMPLSQIRIQTNPDMVRKFDLNVTGTDIVESVAEAQ